MDLYTRKETQKPPLCQVGNEYDGRLGLRIASIFVIWIGSSLGTLFPIVASSPWRAYLPRYTCFVAKHFGSGVIVATAYIHLLSPAVEALGDPCLSGPITEYDWVSGIILMVVFALFIVDVVVTRHVYLSKSHTADTAETSDCSPAVEASFSKDSLSVLLTSIFVLEFGIIFHSILIGLTLAVSGDEFVTLFVVILVHQTFEGIGLGARLALVPWTAKTVWTPYLLGMVYGLTTPVAIGVGLAVRNTYPPGGRTSLIVNGVFDSISAGILIYAGLITLMASEFKFNDTMLRAPRKVFLSAIALTMLGAALMALLGMWA